MPNVERIGFKTDSDPRSGTVPVTMVANSLSGSSVLLDPERSYTIAHDTQNEAGTSDTNTIFMTTSGNPITTPIAAEAKIKLISGRSIVIGPGVDYLAFRTTAGSPTFAVIPGNREYGKF